jgi:two-component system sensor histidine kinase GlrK
LAEAFNHMSRRLSELDQPKLDFISHVSHEMRTPLTAINEASALRAEGRFEARPQQRQELLEIVRNQCGRLTRSIDSIMDLSRMEAGMMTFQFQPGDLGRLVHACVQRMMPIAQRRGVALLELPPPELPSLNFDNRHIDQVLENIVGNALKFTPRGGQVTVATTLDRPGYAAVTVSDSGPGISDEHLKRIFDKFKRIDNGTDSIYGSGIGLSVAKHIISAHKGSIWVESRPGSGARFVFTLPLA